MAQKEIPIPASIEAAWGLRERSAKGPKPGLTLARIVDAGMRVASTDGLGAVSMSRVAGELGAATMALYRYVRAKDELLALMVDAAFKTPPDPRGAAETWRLALSRWARSYLIVLRRHGWLVRVPISGPPILPNQVLWFERGLSSLGGTGLTPPEQMSVLLLVNGFVRNEAILAADLDAAARAAEGSPDDVGAVYGVLLGRLVDAERFPAIHALLASGAFDQPGDADTSFVFGLERILDGVEVLVRARSGSATS